MQGILGLNFLGECIEAVTTRTSYRAKDNYDLCMIVALFQFNEADVYARDKLIANMLSFHT